MLCVVVSGIAGCILGHHVVTYPFYYAAPVIAVAGFLILYCGVVLRIFSMIESRHGIVLPRQNIVAGIIYSALLPFAIVIFVVLLFSPAVHR